MRAPLLPDDRPRRAVVDGVWPQVDGGRFPIKRTTGERVTVTADVFVDGHDHLAVVLRYRQAEAPGASPEIPADLSWRETPMTPAGNDRWTASFMVDTLGRWEYTVEAWVDRFASWRDEVSKKFAAGLDVTSELLEGAWLIRQAAGRARRVPGDEPGAGRLADWLVGRALMLEGPDDMDLKVAAALADSVSAAMSAHADRGNAARYDRTLEVTVERPRARFGAWYEFFPRSTGPSHERPGTLADAAARLPDIAAMGFDVIYLPPVHPIGRSFRKGPNNVLSAGPGDPGSPWAIGSPDGGHTAVDPGLGDLAAFRQFMGTARRFGLEVAIDIAFQASPDHPWVTEHPEWFHHRPDGTIKYAENPPKKYQDIYPFHFDSDEGWRELWQGLAEVVFFWIDLGVRIFRVDNPHTKPFRFWEWLIAEVRRHHADTIFLAEAFTRPKPMCYLAKAGFSQSYTYFTWRNSKSEIASYFTALARDRVREYMRPNLFANTPDILPRFLQTGGKPAFIIRLVLAATLGATYGIYSGFELCENQAVPGTEEYMDSEKYQLRPRDWNRPGHIKELIARVNQIRRSNPALQTDDTLRFHDTDNDALICYSKVTPDLGSRILTVVNLDPGGTQQGFVRVPLAEMGIAGLASFAARDLLTDELFTWRDEWNFVRLEAGTRPAHILRIEG